jgi:hypothetical protein
MFLINNSIIEFMNLQILNRNTSSYFFNYRDDTRKMGEDFGGKINGEE